MNRIQITTWKRNLQPADAPSPPASADMALSPPKSHYYGVTFRPVEKKHMLLCNTLASVFLQWTAHHSFDLIHQFEEYIPFRHIHATIRSSERVVYKDVMLKGYHIFLIPIYDLEKWINYCEKTKVQAEHVQGKYLFK